MGKISEAVFAKRGLKKNPRPVKFNSKNRVQQERG